MSATATNYDLGNRKRLLGLNCIR